MSTLAPILGVGCRHSHVRLAGALIAVAALAHPASAGEFELGVFGGWNGSLPSDVTVVDGGTNFTYQHVPWLGLSFGDGAPYHGIRATYWTDTYPGWGLMLVYTHAKVRADPNATVSYTGDATGSATIASRLSMLEFTDGLNIVTLDAVRRFEPIGRFRPYLGFGLGVNVPHVEVARVGGLRTFAYEWGGPAAEALAGVDATLLKNVSLFGEFRVDDSHVRSALNGGGTISTNVFTNQLVGGAAIQFGNAPSD